MASGRRPIQGRAQPQKYYIFDSGVARELGGVPVQKQDNGLRYVMLLPSQAAYWLASGIIGNKPLTELSEEERYNLHQVSGGRIPTKEGGTILTHQVRSMGLPSRKGDLFKVTTVRNATQKVKAAGLKIGLDPLSGEHADMSITAQQRAAFKAEMQSAQKGGQTLTAHEGLKAHELKGTK